MSRCLQTPWPSPPLPRPAGWVCCPRWRACGTRGRTEAAGEGRAQAGLHQQRRAGLPEGSCGVDETPLASLVLLMELEAL